MKKISLLALLFLIGVTIHAQRLMNSSRSTIGYIESGRVMNSSRSTIGYIEDGRVMNSSRSTIGYFESLKPTHAALYFFFFFD